MKLFKFDRAPTIVNEEEQKVITELKDILNSFYNSLEQKCAGKKDGVQFIKKVKFDLNTKLMEDYIPEIQSIISDKHSEPTDDAFKKQLLDQIKDDLNNHITLEEQGVEFLD